MTRILLILSPLFLLASIALFVAGFSGNAPGLLLAALCGTGPAFLFCFAFALGRLSNVYRVSLTAREQDYSQAEHSRPARRRADAQILS